MPLLAAVGLLLLGRVCGDAAGARCSVTAAPGTPLCGPWGLDFDDDPAIVDYLRTCKRYGIEPAADILTELQYGGPNFSLNWGQAQDGFTDLDMRALVRLLLYGEGQHLHCIHSLDVSAGRLGSAGMLLLAQLVQHPESCIQSLDLSHQSVGPEGMRYLAQAMNKSSTLTSLTLYMSGLGDEGGEVLAELLSTNGAASLRYVDAQNNNIAASICNKILSATQGKNISVELSGNRVIDEILNAVTHGLGEVAAIIGSVFLCLRVSTRPTYFRTPTILYCISLNTLYMASTLYHSFFALGHTTVYIFSLLDYSGIFVLIAGSYAPFLGILFHGECWAIWLMRMMVSVAVAGIIVAAAYHGPGAEAVRLTLFLAMGWAVLACLPRIAAKLGRHGTALLALGGVFYTVGVPWFVRNRHTLGFPDHAIWHLWVMAGSMTHYHCICWHVIPDDGAVEDRASLLMHDMADVVWMSGAECSSCGKGQGSDSDA